MHRTADAQLIASLRGPLRHLLTTGAPIHLHSAPGRLDLLGGLASQAGGTVAQIALPHRAAVAVQKRSDGKVLVHGSGSVAARGGSGEAGMEFELPLENLHPGRTAMAPKWVQQVPGESHWAVPILSLCQRLQHQGPAGKDAGGVTILAHSHVPVEAGQAAATALAVAAGLALAQATQSPVDPLDMALAVNRAQELAGVAGAHVVDAMTCLHATEGHALRYSAQPHQLVGQVKLPKDVRVMALDTTVRPSSPTGERATVEAVRLAGAMGLRIVETIYKDLGQRHTPLHGHLTNLSPALYRQYFRALLPRRMRGRDFVRTFGELPQKAGNIEAAKVYRVRAAVDHLISEHDHAEHFLQAFEELSDPATRKSLTAGQRERILQRAGRLVLASHHSYRLRLELSCAEADWLVEQLMEAGPEKGIYGARITSAGGGGTVAVVMKRSGEAMDALLKAVSGYNRWSGKQLGVQEAGAAGGLETAGATL